MHSFSILIEEPSVLIKRPIVLMRNSHLVFQIEKPRSSIPIPKNQVFRLENLVFDQVLENHTILSSTLIVRSTVKVSAKSITIAHLFSQPNQKQ